VWLDTESRLAHIGAHEFMGDADTRFGAAAKEAAEARRAAA
jgi:hypothetical protein